MASVKTSTALKIAFRSEEKTIMSDLAKKLWEAQLTGKINGGMTNITMLLRSSIFYQINSKGRL
jgi:hypothetical protein